jgi:hypothetical protein
MLYLSLQFGCECGIVDVNMHNMNIYTTYTGLNKVELTNQHIRYDVIIMKETQLEAWSLKLVA